MWDTLANSEMYYPTPPETAIVGIVGEDRMSDRWRSPQWIIDMFQGYYDPCPIDYKIDAFSYDWCEDNSRVYVNPPYSNPTPWVEKAIY